MKNPLKIQTILFDKDKFTINSAIKFLKRNKLNYNKVDIPKTGKYLRFRQFPPHQFIKGSYRTEPFGKKDGVLVIYAKPKDKKMNNRYKKNPFSLKLDDGIAGLSFELSEKELSLLNSIPTIRNHSDTLVKEISEYAKDLIVSQNYADDEVSMEDKQIDKAVNKTFELLKDYGSKYHAQTIIDVLKKYLPRGYSAHSDQVLSRINTFARKFNLDQIIKKGDGDKSVYIHLKDQEKLGDPKVKLSIESSYEVALKEMLRIVTLLTQFSNVRSTFFTEKNISVYQTTVDVYSVHGNIESLLKAEKLKTQGKARLDENEIFFNFPMLIFSYFLETKASHLIYNLEAFVKYFSRKYLIQGKDVMYTSDKIKDLDTLKSFSKSSSDIVSLATNLYLLKTTKTVAEQNKNYEIVFGKQGQLEYRFDPHRPFYLDFTNDGLGMATIGIKIRDMAKVYSRVYNNMMLAELGGKQDALLCSYYASTWLRIQQFKAIEYGKKLKEANTFTTENEFKYYLELPQSLAPTHNDGLYLAHKKIKQFKGNEVPTELDAPATDYDFLQLSMFDVGNVLKNTFQGGIKGVRDLIIKELSKELVKGLFNSMLVNDGVTSGTQDGSKFETYEFGWKRTDGENITKKITFWKEHDPYLYVLGNRDDEYRSIDPLGNYSQHPEYYKEPLKHLRWLDEVYGKDFIKKNKKNIRQLKYMIFNLALDVWIKSGILTKTYILDLIQNDEEIESPIEQSFLDKTIPVRITDRNDKERIENINRRIIQFNGIEYSQYRLVKDKKTRKEEFLIVSSNEYLDDIHLDLYPDDRATKDYFRAYGYKGFDTSGKPVRAVRTESDTNESDIDIRFKSEKGNFFTIGSPKTLSTINYKKKKLIEDNFTSAQFEDLKKFEKYCRELRKKQIDDSIYAERQSLEKDFLKELANDEESCKRKFRQINKKQISFFNRRVGLKNEQGQVAYRQISFSFSEETQEQLKEDQKKGGKFETLLRAKSFYALDYLQKSNNLLPPFATMNFLELPKLFHYVDLGDTMGQFFLFRYAQVSTPKVTKRDKNKLVFTVSQKPLIYLVTKKKDIVEEEVERIDMSLDRYRKYMSTKAGQKKLDEIRKKSPQIFVDGKPIIPFDPFIFKRTNPSDEYACGILETLRKQGFFYPYQVAQYGNRKKDLKKVIQPQDLKSKFISRTGDVLQQGKKYYLVGGGVEEQIDGNAPKNTAWNVIMEEDGELNSELKGMVSQVKGGEERIKNIEHGVVISIERLPEIVEKFDKIGLYDLAFAMRLMFMRDPDFVQCDEQRALGKAGTLEQIKDPKLRAKVAKLTAKIQASGTGQGAMSMTGLKVTSADTIGYYMDKGKKKFFKPYPYQQIGIYFAKTLNFSCLIADDMGLGKTVQGMASLKVAEDLHKKYPKQYPSPFPCLVICPASIMQKWYEEWYTWYPEYKAQIIDSETLVKRKSYIEKAKVYIGSYKGMTSKSTLNFYLEKKPNFFIFDEAHRMKTITSLTAVAGTILQGIPLEGTPEIGTKKLKGIKRVVKVIRSQFTQSHELPFDRQKFGSITELSPILRTGIAPYRLMLTGTPLENKIQECYMLLKFINPSKYMDFKQFIGYFDGTKATQTGVKLGKTGFAFLRAQLQCVMIRRFKTQVLPKDFPPKMRIQQQVILPDSAMQAYKKVIEMMPQRAKQRKLEERTLLGSQIFLGTGNRMARLINESSIMANDEIEPLKGKTLESLAKNSGMQALNDSVRIIGEAKVQFVATFINDFFNTPDGRFVNGDTDLFDTVEKRNNKTLQLVIFVKHKFVSESIHSFCNENDISSRIVDGTTRNTRSQDIKDFQQGEYQVIIGSQAIREGINLFPCNHLLFAELWWNPAKMEQAEDRIWRIGQTRPCFCFYAIGKDTVDEKVFEKLEAKKSLVNTLIGSEQIETDKEDKDEALQTFADYMSEQYGSNQSKKSDFIKSYGRPLTSAGKIAEFIGVPLNICITDPQRAREYAKSRKFTQIFGTGTSKAKIKATKLSQKLITQAMLLSVGQVTTESEKFDYGYEKAGRILQKANEDQYGDWNISEIEWFTKISVERNGIDLDAYSQPAYIIDVFFDDEEIKYSYIDMSRVNIEICKAFIIKLEDQYKYSVGETELKGKNLTHVFRDLAKLLVEMIDSVKDGVSKKTKLIKQVEDYINENFDIGIEFVKEKNKPFTSSSLRKDLAQVRTNNKSIPNLNALYNKERARMIRPSTFRDVDESTLKLYKTMMSKLIKSMKTMFFL